MTYDWDVNLALGNAAQVGNDILNDGGDVGIAEDTVARKDWKVERTALSNAAEVADNLANDGGNVQAVCNTIARELFRLAYQPRSCSGRRHLPLGYRSDA